MNIRRRDWALLAGGIMIFAILVLCIVYYQESSLIFADLVTGALKSFVNFISSLFGIQTV